MKDFIEVHYSLSDPKPMLLNIAQIVCVNPHKIKHGDGGNPDVWGAAITTSNQPEDNFIALENYHQVMAKIKAAGGTVIL